MTRSSAKQAGAAYPSEADGTGRPRRAAPMTPDDRRAAILAAAVPLLRDRGPVVTTRELAEAACVAQGTLFSVFPDKEALVAAAVEQALDPAPVLADLAALDQDLDVRDLLTRAVQRLQVHSQDVTALLAVGHEISGGMPHHGRAMHPRGHHPVATVVRGVAELLDPHRARLRLEPAVCARLLVGIVITTTHPLTTDAQPALTPRQLVDLFLDGALVRSTPSEDPC